MNYGSDNHKEAIEKACKELEEAGFKTVKIEKRIPDIIAYKGEIAFVEVKARGHITKTKREYQEAYVNIPLKLFIFKAPAQDYPIYYTSSKLVMGFISPEGVS